MSNRKLVDDGYEIEVDRLEAIVVDRVRARDVEHRAASLGRAVERWSRQAFWICSVCRFLDSGSAGHRFEVATCPGCDAVLSLDVSPGSSGWLEGGAVLAAIDEASTEAARSRLVDVWVEDRAAEVRTGWATEDHDVTWGPADLLDQVQDGVLDGIVGDLRIVDWRAVAAGLARWLDDHPRSIDPTDFLHVVALDSAVGGPGVSA